MNAAVSAKTLLVMRLKAVEDSFSPFEQRLKSISNYREKPRIIGDPHAIAERAVDTFWEMLSGDPNRQIFPCVFRSFYGGMEVENRDKN